jgi:hypothetical protein
MPINANRLRLEVRERETERELSSTYVLDFLCHILAFPFRFSAQALPLFAH